MAECGHRDPIRQKTAAAPGARDGYPDADAARGRDDCRTWAGRGALWGEAGEDDALRTHLYALRRSLREAFGEAPIHSERGLGVRFGGRG